MAIDSGVDNGPENTIIGGHVQSATSNSALASQSQQPNKHRTTACRFFQKGKICRAGDSCRFLHITEPSSEAANAHSTKDRINDEKPRNYQSQHKEKEEEEYKGKAEAKGKSNNRLKGKGKAKGIQKGDSVRKTQIDELMRLTKWTVKRLSSRRGETAFAIEMKPSDPDFPFDVSRLYMAFVVPAQYPATRTSDPILEIQIANKTIPLGIKRNIETGFSKHVRKTVNAAIDAGTPESVPSFEEYISWLDANLELMMQQKAAPTIKFSNFGASKTDKTATDAAAAVPKQRGVSGSIDNDSGNSDQYRPKSLIFRSSSVAAAVTPPTSRPAVQRPAPKSMADASSDSDNPRRAAELRQLERRFRSSFKSLNDSATEDTVVSLNIMPTDPDMQGFDICQFTVTIKVGRQYPVELPSSLTISIDSSRILGRKNKPSSWQPGQGRQIYLDYISMRFSQHVEESPASSILHHLNWLDRQLVSLVSLVSTQAPSSIANQHVIATNSSTTTKTDSVSETVVKAEKLLADHKHDLFGNVEEQKPWIKTISLEEAGISQGLAQLDIDSSNADALSDDSSEKERDGESASEEENLEEEEEAVNAFSKPIRRGIEIRLGRIQLTNISIAHCHSLNLNVRCARCKSMVELKGVSPTLRVGKDNQMWKACDTCTAILGVRFRPDWIFAGCTAVGFLDCSGCAPMDLLQSKFTLFCEPCAMNDDAVEEESKSVSLVASVGVGTSANTACKTCFSRLGIELYEPHFVQLQSGPSLGGTANAASMISREVERTRKARVNKREELARLGVIPGQPLPSHGACKHFSRSKRWLRFPCCGKAYPCVTCHDDKEDHDYEYAQIMICGHCAKEQRISKAEQTGLCISCGFQVLKKIDGNHAFWQGGTGVRDRTRMSRKDSKKFQGLGKTVAQKKVATPKKS
ncbi:hypothetical protein LPJ64_002620 [Coemansia asiatica]|uniref:CHY-type domain-containing protein n=1 Tax=Coemansia asiatica TaxID=1052880 RepID=A0A9W7XMC9_9FUNG|nr:hypothetical protein LPJ64_002620 [Coemansia asiatica]